MVFKYHAKLNSNNTEHQVWQQNSRPKIIVQSRFAQQKLNYIHYNPIRAGYVNFPQDYPYSSYRNYYHEKEFNCPLPVNIMSFD